MVLGVQVAGLPCDCFGHVCLEDTIGLLVCCLFASWCACSHGCSVALDNFVSWIDTELDVSHCFCSSNTTGQNNYYVIRDSDSTAADLGDRYSSNNISSSRYTSRREWTRISISSTSIDISIDMGKFYCQDTESVRMCLDPEAQRSAVIVMK